MKKYDEDFDNIPVASGPMQAQMLTKGMALQKIETPYTTAIMVQKPRDITKFTSSCLAEAKLAKDSMYWGWNVNTKQGKRWIEGPTIALAMCMARHYMNCAINVDVEETPTHYMFTAYFVDLESGLTSPRLFRQRKSQSMGGKMQDDMERQEDIVFQIGQSKAIRNAVVRAMPEYIVEAMIAAGKEALKREIENVPLAKAKAVESFFERYGVAQDALERSLSKTAENWSGDDLVKLRGMLQALNERRVSVEEMFPAPAAKEEPEPVKVEPKPTTEGITPPEPEKESASSEGVSSRAVETSPPPPPVEPPPPKQRKTRSDKGTPRRAEEPPPSNQGDESPPPWESPGTVWVSCARRKGSKVAKEVCEQRCSYVTDCEDYRNIVPAEKKPQTNGDLSPAPIRDQAPPQPPVQKPAAPAGNVAQSDKIACPDKPGVMTSKPYCDKYCKKADFPCAEYIRVFRPATA